MSAARGYTGGRLGRAAWPRRPAGRGFTLVEVLIAIAILAMISTLLFTSFSSLKRSKDGIRRVSERHREGRMAMARVARELQSAYISRHLPPDINQAVVRTAFIGTQGAPADRIDFNAFVHRRMDRDARESDQVELSYFGMPSETERGVFDLVRRNNTRLDHEPEKGGRVQILATDIDLFDLRYLDPLTGLWVEEWDSTESIKQFERMPLQVRVVLVLNGGARGSEGRARDPLTFATKVSMPLLQPLSFALE